MKNSWTPILLLGLGAIFLLKGGVAVVMGLWRVFLPLVLVGGGYYLVRKYMKSVQLAQGPGGHERIRRQPSASAPGSNVIEICPHCLQEVGSCPKCR